MERLDGVHPCSGTGENGMSIHHVNGSVADTPAQWRGGLAGARSGSGGSSNTPAGSSLAADLNDIAQAFRNLLSGIESDLSAASMPAGTRNLPAGSGGSAFEQLLGARTPGGDAAAASPGAGTPSAAGNIVQIILDNEKSPAGQEAANAAASTPVGRATSTSAASPLSNHEATRGPASPAAASDTQNPSSDNFSTTSNNVDVACCTFAQAQSVLAAFPGATLELWSQDGATSMNSAPAGADTPQAYVIAFGTNPATGGPNLCYAGMIYNSAQQAMQQSGDGTMVGGDYYVWNNTPNSSGAMTTTDVGSSFTQYVQYYASQLTGGNAVNPYVYTAEA